MSNLLVQNIKHTNNTTAQTIDTSGRTTVSIMNNDSTYRSDGGAVTQNLVQGLAKAWMKFNGTGTPAINDSLNFSSIVDEGTGNYQLIFSNNMGNDSYCITTHDLGYGNGWSDSQGTSGFDTRRRNESAAYNDVIGIWALVHGDLA